MSKRPQSALDAMNAELHVLRQHDRSSYAPLVRDRAQRKRLATICANIVSQALRGDTDAAMRILEDFVRSVRQHSKRSWPGPNHYLYARYLADALQRILDGKHASIALGVKNSRPGRRKGSVTHNAKALAAAFWLLHRKGLATEKCNELLCRLTGADRTTVQNSREAPNTKAFNRPDLITERALKSIVAKQAYGKALLKLLRVTGPSGGTSPPE
jgi:hypothetical protein